MIWILGLYWYKYEEKIGADHSWGKKEDGITPGPSSSKNKDAQIGQKYIKQCLCPFKGGVPN